MKIQDNSQAIIKRRTPLAANYAWVTLWVVYAASVAAALNQYKVPPILPLLMNTFSLNLATAGSLMSVFSVTGLLLALPAGIILQRLGAKTTGLIALGCLAAGSTLGAVSTSIGLLLGGRVVEGIGMGLLCVVAPATIAMWFPKDKQGAPMGIWATWVPTGSLVMYILAPALGASAGWQAVWWVGTGFSLVVMLAYWLLMRSPRYVEAQAGGHTDKVKVSLTSDLGEALANRDIWLLGLQFVCFNLAMIALGTFLPTFLSEVRGYSLASASWIASISTVSAFFSAPLAGRLSDRIHSRRLVFSLPYLAITTLMLLPFRVAGWQFYAVMALLGLVAGAIPTATFAAAPEVMKKPQWAGFGLAVIMLGQNLGCLIGPILFGELVKTLGWVTAGFWLIPACLVGFLAAWMVRVR